MKRLPGWGLLLAVGVFLPPAPDASKAGEDPPAEAVAGKAALTIDNGGHVGVISGMVFAPDGRRLITVGHDGTVQEHDPDTGLRMKVTRPPIGPGVGNRLNGVAAVRKDGAATKEDQAAGRFVAVIGSGIEKPGAKMVVNRLFLLNRETGTSASFNKLPGLAATTRPEVVAGLPDRGLIAVAKDETIVLRKKLGGPKADSEPVTLTTSKGDRIRGLRFSPDGTRLAASAVNSGGRLSVWNLAAKGRPRLMSDQRVDNWVLGMAWSPSGKRIVTGHGANADQVHLRLWSGQGKLEKSFTRKQLSPRLAGAGNVFVEGLAFRYENIVLLTASWGTKALGNQLVLSVNVKTGVTRELLFHKDVTTPHPGPLEALTPLAVSPDRKLAAVAVEPRGSRIAWLDLTGKDEPRFSGDTHGLRRPIAWSTDGTTITWRTRDPKAPNGFLNLKALVGGGSEGKREFANHSLEQDGWKVERTGEPGKKHLKISRNGKVTGRTPFTDSPIDFVALSASGKAPWVAWSTRTTGYISDAATGKTLALLRPRTRFLGLASSPDGRYLLAASSREMLYVYRVGSSKKQALQPLLTIYPHGPDWIAWTRRGYYAATPGGERLMGWTVPNGLSQPAAFHPASRFRKQLYQPELIALVLEKGNLADALAALPKKEGPVARGAAVEVDDLLPPSVEIEEIDTAKLPKVTVKVRAKATAAGQPVVSLRLLVNGRPLSDAAYQVDLGKGKTEHTLTWTFDAPEGKSELAVLARSPDSMALSPEKAVSFKAPPASRLFALCVGVDKYAQVEPKIDLKAAGNDARAVAAALEKRCAAPLFASAKANVLLDAKATKRNVLEALAALQTRPDEAGPIKPTDLVVVYFAGHGVKVKDEFYLLPHDASTAKPENIVKTCISGAELRKALSGFRCQVVLLLDACHSGASRRALNEFRPATDDATRAMTDEEVGVVVLAAAMGHEYALEKEEAKGWRGHFARAVEEAITRGPGVPFNTRDRHVYVHHLFSYVFDRVKDLSDDEQHPSLNLPSTVESFPLVPEPKAG